MRDAYERVIRFNQDRDARFLPLKYKLMSSSAFRFFRGSCHLFYEDLAQHQTWEDQALAWICGDLHVENFGSYKSSQNVVYFDLNDFDEAVLAYPSWDVVRFICSIFLAGNELNLQNHDLKNIAQTLLNEYLDALIQGKAFALEKETLDGILKKYIKTVAERDPIVFLNAHSQFDGHNKRVLTIDQKKYFSIDSKKNKQQLMTQFQDYLNIQNEHGEIVFQVLDVAIRVAGTGSIGLTRYVFLVEQTVEKQFYLYDVKQAQASSLMFNPILKNQQPAWKNEAERIQTIQNFMQYIPPALFSRFSFQGQSYLVKALQSEQDKMDFKQCIEKSKKFTDACHYMARLMAYAQIRSAGRKGSDNIDELIDFAAHAQVWKTQLLEYAYNYYQQVLRDYESFCNAYASQQQIDPQVII
ncbi:DUF2252 domain-containing protein [Acinetobacter sp. ANC 4648]|uniref:DUF2252 domain-containing protein n=1 Tax=Acinetobacter sp. ANC 4648 TaxID=1977875 RepID=UPI000A33D662|nr:DUF2252 family protein [Acinetobacter sp. ANC 4648]OTG83806.1 hypothetical protein B9T27_04685 [Acinetobacter sp. ANC 4648]